MSTTTLGPAGAAGPSRTRTAFRVLLTIAVVVLLAAAFAIGRATASASDHAPAVPAITPTTAAHEQVGACPLHSPC